MTPCLKLIHWNNMEVSDSTQNEVTQQHVKDK